MIIKNAMVYTEEGSFIERDIFIKDGYFVEKLKDVKNEEILDAKGCYAIPGLTDIHFHGCAGYDVCDGTKEAIRAIAAYEASVGVTSIVPATMTLEEESLLRICENIADYRKRENTSGSTGADLCGLHLEGPFVSKQKKGAQNSAYIRKPDIALYERLDKASGYMMKLVSMAPELEGAMEFIEAMSGRVVVSLAHTVADYDIAMKAFGKGAAHVTHLYNAMNSYTHRAPGILAAAADAGAEVELICDGIHIHPAAVRTTFRIFGDDKIIFISDSMRATGLADGVYQLGGQQVKVEGKRATLEDGTIAGSVTNLLDCMRLAVLEMGIPLESAVKCAAVNPAKCVGIYERYGSITPGKLANVVLLEKENLELRKVVHHGYLVF